jgi:acetyl-CoA carboxylase/biotin carboxylase 1
MINDKLNVIMPILTKHKCEEKVCDGKKQRKEDINLIEIMTELKVNKIKRIELDGSCEKSWNEAMHIYYESMFDTDETKSGVASFVVENIYNMKFVIIAHHKKYNNQSMGVNEKQHFKVGSKYARENNLPRIYLCKTTGACLDYDHELVKDLIIEKEKIYIKKSNLAKWDNRVVVSPADNKEMYEVTRIKNRAIDTLDGCAEIASETSLAYDNVFTLTYVSGYAVGIGAYLARLGHRVIQKKTGSPLLLTGYTALNGLLGDDLYVSDEQLGGSEIMSTNGVSHLLADNDNHASKMMLNWLNITLNTTKPMISTESFWKICKDKHLSTIIDEQRIFETMAYYGNSVFTGRCYIDNKPYAIIYSNSDPSSTIVPADPGNLQSEKQIVQNSGSVLYPDSSYKFAQTIYDADKENIPLLLWLNWRGFSGGTRDMFNEILKFGSMIVDSLRVYKNDIVAYLPPGCELRGGAMVVLSSSINKNIRMYADPSAKIGILEPSGAYEIKYKRKLKDENISKADVIKTIELYDKPYNSDVLKVVNLKDIKQYL